MTSEATDLNTFSDFLTTEHVFIPYHFTTPDPWLQKLKSKSDRIDFGLTKFALLCQHGERKGPEGKELADKYNHSDCFKCLIFWSPITNDRISEEVKLRRKESVIVPYQSDFISENAKPLVSDLTLFDFDPSYKEMIVKSQEVAKKVVHKSVTVNDVNSLVANLLHVYILPAIKFSSDDLYALSRARCLIEERHMQSDADISAKAQAINLLQLSLENLKDNLLLKDDFESESYLQSCNGNFLRAFLKKIEADSLKLNLDLEAQQSKVNWAKVQQYEKHKIVDLQKRRDNLFKEVEKLIKVREALKNVVTRKAKTKKKKARQQILDSCFHNVFLEILRRLEIENKTMEQLVEDKLNISAAREAILSVILDFDDHKRIPSDRSTRFEPSSFGDFHIDGNVRREKSDVWLTLQERVSKILRDTSSNVFYIHTTGCKNIKSRIDLALSEFRLHASKQSSDGKDGEGNKGECRKNDTSANSSEPLSERDMLIDQQNEPEIGFELNVEPEKPLSPDPVEPASENTDDQILLRSALRPLSVSQISRRSGQVITSETWNIVPREESLISTQNLKPRKVDSNSTSESISEQDEKLAKIEEVSLDYIVIDSPDESPETPVQQSNIHFISENLAINTLMSVVDKVKAVVHEHFKDVVRSLQEDLNPESLDPYEILWKAYERHFSEEVLQSLSLLYHTMLEPGNHAVYKEIRRTSMQELLEGDKILNLFFKPRARHGSMGSSDDPTQSFDTYSMDMTLSTLSLDVRNYSVNELYNLANADSTTLRQRFQLETDDPADGDVAGSPASSGSGASVKTSDLFDEEDEGISHSDNCFPHQSEVGTNGTNTLDSRQSLSSGSDEGKEIRHDSDVKSSSSDIGCDIHLESQLFLSPQEILNMLEPVLSPFRKQIVKCLKARSILDKMRYLSKGVQGLNNDISHLYGADHMSVCDDIISMLVLSLANMTEDIFVGLYSNLRLLIDVLPSFLSGTLCDFNLVSLCAAYDYLLNRNVCQRVVKRYATSFKVKYTPS